MPAPSNIPAVTKRNLVLANDVSTDIKKLEIEEKALVIAIAANPSHPQVTLLNARRAAIQAARVVHE